ncbi:caspase-8-like isoform X1 [Bufo gargarizans]|uniref:caspase-8-like isoform X1 n=1 Tax=Bufo gargarizans TaxID=30331 RepID=UPI001CF25DA6|nr:caspase-8-like isoform X1 [Bufo gargarizans]
MDKDLQTTLLQISDELADKEVEAMIFLCGKNLKEADKENIKEGTTLFSTLKKKGFVSKDNLLFLKELLSKIGRKDILANVLKTTENEMEELERSFQHVPKYRSLLYDISMNLASEETEKIMFLLSDEIRHLRNLNKAKCMMVVLSEMEKQRKLSEDNLQMLKSHLEEIGRSDLSHKIKTFEEQCHQSVLHTELEKMAIQEASGGDVNVNSVQHDNENDPSLTDNQFEEYKLDKIPHGLCVVVNNYNFSEARKSGMKMKDRPGTHQDADTICRVFSSRDYEVIQHNDLTGEQMLNTIKIYAKENHAEKDSFVCFVLSHGDKGIVFGTDGKKVPVNGLTDCFNGLQCPSLVGKPKVFFFQACQGDKSDTGVLYVSDSISSVYVNDALGQKLPITADFLTAFASVEEYESLRCPTTGSVYIQTLCSALQNHHFFTTDLIRIITHVQNKIADRDYTIKKEYGYLEVKQMPTHQSELRKILILPPPSNGQQAS